MNKRPYYIILFFAVALSACKQRGRQVFNDNPRQGTIQVSVDESFRPVIEEQIKLYENTFPNAHIVAHYKPESDCLRDLDQDSTRMIIIARGLTDAESAHYQAKLSFKPTWDILAYDAVDVVVNRQSPDSVFTLPRLRALLAGEDKSLKVVLDGKKATSTVRFLLDSVMKGKKLGTGIMGADDSKGVLDFVSSNPGAVGFVGSSWIGNDEDPAQKAYDNSLKLALVSCTVCGPDVVTRPSQASISYAQYPLVRPLYYVLKDNFGGLGSGFMNFMSTERGQLIFRRSYLVPAKMYFGVRTINIKNI